MFPFKTFLAVLCSLLIHFTVHLSYPFFNSLLHKMGYVSQHLPPTFSPLHFSVFTFSIYTLLHHHVVFDITEFSLVFSCLALSLCPFVCLYFFQLFISLFSALQVWNETNLVLSPSLGFSFPSS